MKPENFVNKSLLNESYLNDVVESKSILDVSKDLAKEKSQSKSWARVAFFTWLSGLSHGRLTIYDQGETFTFGKSTETAELTAHIRVEDNSFYNDLIVNGALGAGEAYMRGSWSSPNLVNVIRVMAVNLAHINNLNKQQSWGKKLVLFLYSLKTRNNLTGSRKNISAHYDLGNDFFSLFLDPTMMYSAAIYPNNHSTLNEASINKLDTICKKLDLSADDHVIEIGTGWGGFAVFAAKNYGCKVTTTTISKEQYEYAAQQVKQYGLEDKITLLFKDYRDLEGQYDKLVSIEMIEAVGHEYFSSFFSKCSSLLKENGKLLIQAITISDQRYKKSIKSVDFIQRYIFPGGCLPSNEVISQKVSSCTDMQIVDVHDITHDYSRTLADWRTAFFERIDQVRAQGYDETFIRMWDYYLCYCQGGFDERVIQTYQYVMGKPRAKFIK